MSKENWDFLTKFWFSGNLITFWERVFREDVGQDGKYTEINFATWIVFNMPIAAINLILVWIYLGWLYLRKGGKANKHSGVQLELALSQDNSVEGQ